MELQRPFVPHTGFPIIGDWIEGSAHSGGFACLHVALGADSALVIWSDYIDLPGFVGYGQNGTVPPSSTREWYGELDMDPEMKNIGSSAHFGSGPTNGAFNPFTWRRTRDCATST